MVSGVLGLDPDYEHTGGDRGWIGDVPRMRLSVEKLAALGWEPPASGDSSRAVRSAYCRTRQRKGIVLVHTHRYENDN